MEKTKDVECQVIESELSSSKNKVDKMLSSHLILLESRLQDHRYEREMYDRLDEIRNYDSY